MKEDLEFDEWCDPENPRKIKFDDILAAGRRIVGAIVRTPCYLAHMSDKLGMDVYIKAEYLQYTGCFKERGVTNALALLSDEQKKYGVCTCTTGNHGLALAYHCTKMNIPCVVVMTIHTAINKVMKCEKYGAKIIQHGNNFEEARRFALGLAKEKKMAYINGYDHPHVIEGQGTIGLEILDQVPGLDAVLVPVGGGSLLAGIGVAVKHLKPDTEVYGIETDKTNSMVESLRKNERVVVNMPPSLANALAVPLVGVNTFQTIKGLVDKMVVVREDWVARAIMHVVEDERCIVEGGGVIGIAAIMAGLFPNLKGKKVVVIASGGNIEPVVLGRALEHGMACEGRLVKFSVKTSDQVMALADITNLLATVGVTIRDCVPERTYVKGDVFSRKYKFLVETRGWDHTKELAEAVRKRFPDSFFPEMAERPDKASSARRGPCLAPNPVCMQK